MKINIIKKRRIEEVPITIVNNSDFRTNRSIYEQKINFNLLARLVGNQIDFSEIIHNSTISRFVNNKLEKMVTNNSLAEYFYHAYSGIGLGNNEKERKIYLDHFKKKNVLGGMELYFEKQGLLLLPHQYWQIPQISQEIYYENLGWHKKRRENSVLEFKEAYSKEHDWLISEDLVLKDLVYTNIFELQRKGSNELQYTSGVFLCEDSKMFHIIHSSKINDETKELIDPQITPVMKLKDRIKVLNLKFDN